MQFERDNAGTGAAAAPGEPAPALAQLMETPEWRAMVLRAYTRAAQDCATAGCGKPNAGVPKLPEHLPLVELRKAHSVALVAPAPPAATAPANGRKSGDGTYQPPAPGAGGRAVAPVPEAATVSASAPAPDPFGAAGGAPAGHAPAAATAAPAAAAAARQRATPPGAFSAPLRGASGAPPARRSGSRANVLDGVKCTPGALTAQPGQLHRHASVMAEMKAIEEEWVAGKDCHLPTLQELEGKIANEFAAVCSAAA